MINVVILNIFNSDMNNFITMISGFIILVINKFNSIFYPSATFILTVLTGLFILVIGQIIIRFIIEPIQQQDRIIGDIYYTLSYYANIYTQHHGMDINKLKETSVHFGKMQ